MNSVNTPPTTLNWVDSPVFPLMTRNVPQSNITRPENNAIKLAQKLNFKCIKFRLKYESSCSDVLSVATYFLLNITPNSAVNWNFLLCCICFWLLIEEIN